jgi:hypothetical protein
MSIHRRPGLRSRQRRADSGRLRRERRSDQRQYGRDLRQSVNANCAKKAEAPRDGASLVS